MNRFQPKKHIAQLNEAKRSLTTFTVPEILEKFKECKLPANRTFFNAFRVWGTINQISKTHYKFKSSNPINYEELDVIYNTYRSKRNAYKWK